MLPARAVVGLRICLRASVGLVGMGLVEMTWLAGTGASLFNAPSRYLPVQTPIEDGL